MEDGRRAVNRWVALLSHIPSAELAAQAAQALLERWPTQTRAVVHREQYQNINPGRPRACQHCAITMQPRNPAQRYCSPACKLKAEQERKRLRKTAGFTRR